MLLKFSDNYPNNSAATNLNPGKDVMKDSAREAGVKFFAMARNAWLGFNASIIGFFKSYKFKEIIFSLKVISAVLLVLLLLGLIITIVKTIKLGRTVTKTKKNSKRFLKIEKKLASGQQENYKLAVLEADAFYDDNLKILGYEKESRLSSIDEIKKAKRVKKDIVDNNNYILTKEEAEKSVDAYKRGLKELGAI